MQTMVLNAGCFDGWGVLLALIWRTNDNTTKAGNSGAVFGAVVEITRSVL